MNTQQALQTLLGGGGLGGLAVQISNAVSGSGNGQPGGASPTATAALTTGAPAPTPASSMPHWYSNPWLIGAAAAIGALFVILSVVKRR